MANIVTLRSPNGAYEAKILPDRGANCLALTHTPSGISALRTYDPDTFELDNPFLYGTPLLFPPNRIKGGRFTYDGREYALPVNEEATGCFLHGTLHETPFAVAEVTENTVTCRYEATEECPYLTSHAVTLHKNMGHHTHNAGTGLFRSLGCSLHQPETCTAINQCSPHAAKHGTYLGCRLKIARSNILRCCTKYRNTFHNYKACISLRRL